jgi:hypothetical protein
MKTFARHLRRDYRVRNICLIATGLLFLLSVSELIVGVNSDNVGIWRGLALSSLYLNVCLTQKRLFVPPSRQVIRSRWHSQHGD